jgi:hypothetical protein
MPRGVKTVISEERLIEAIHDNFGIVTSICQVLGISKPTFYKLLTDKCKDELTSARETTTDRVENSFLNNCLQGDRVCQIFYLKTRGRNRGYKEEDTKKEELTFDLTRLNDKQLKNFEQLMEIVEGKD